jgi:hypothetical protein
MVDTNRFITVIVCAIIAILAVAGRFWCKFILRGGFQADDWWALTTVISYVGIEIALLWGEHAARFLYLDFLN